jgi:class 3 adenylate cyclase/tetratricopeptide (TPR) repeat protein
MRPVSAIDLSPMAACPACRRENPEGFRFCGFCGGPLFGRDGAALSERKTVTVLFCDLVGFTASSEHSDPEAVQARLAPYHRRVRERIEAFGGTMEKFVGDAVMAVFGAPVVHEDDPERAIRTGLAILEEIRELNETDPALSLSVRVGVNTGEAVVSIGARPELGVGMVTGDVVNTAARIQSQAPVGGVAVGLHTYKAARRVFAFESLAPITAKGKEQPVSVWRAVAPLASFERDVAGPVTPFVGRELDLALLRGVFEKAVAEPSVQLVTVVGEPGIGKSRLVAELGAHIDDLDAPVTWRHGRCLPYGDGITFWALGEVVKAHAGIYESDPSEVALEKLEAALPDGEERPWLRARLMPLLGLDPSDSAAQDELFTAWRRFFESLAEKQPLAMIVEDIHWADPALVAFLKHLTDWAQGIPLLVVCTARPELFEIHPDWGGGLANHTSIRLSPLSDSDTALLVAALLEHAVLGADTQDLLLGRASGNPLYAVEFARMLRDREALGGHGLFKTGADVAVPDSIQALIAARLDTLPLEHKALLQDGAVMGKVFWAGSVSAMSDQDDRTVEEVLHELARKELVRPARQSSMEGEAEYAFGHLLVRDVAYEQIPRAQRAGRHVKAAAWLENKAAGRVEDLAEVLAYHTGEALRLAEIQGNARLRADVAPAAGRYALLAGERALGLDTTKALTLLERAKALIPDTDSTFAFVLLRWGDAAHQAGMMREGVHAVEQAATSFEAQGDLIRAGEALSLLANIRRRLGEPETLTTAQRAVALLEATPGPELIAALAGLADLQYATGADEAAVRSAEEALALAEQMRLPVPGKALGFRGSARCAMADLRGLADMERALELLIRDGSGRDAGVLQCNLVLERVQHEGPAATLAMLADARVFAEERGLTETTWFAAAASINGLVMVGRFTDALDQADRLLPALRASGERLQICHVLKAEAAALTERGVDASAQAEEALEIAHRAEDPILLMYTAWGVARALVAVGDPKVAHALLDEIAAAPVHHDSRYAEVLPALARAAHKLSDLALVERLAKGVPRTLPGQQHALATVSAIKAEAVGDHAKAAGLYADAGKRWGRFTNVLEQAHALLAQGRCLVSIHDRSADQTLRKSRALFEGMGANPRIAECDRLIAQVPAA